MEDYTARQAFEASTSLQGSKFFIEKKRVMSLIKQLSSAGYFECRFHCISGNEDSMADLELVLNELGYKTEVIERACQDFSGSHIATSIKISWEHLKNGSK